MADNNKQQLTIWGRANSVNVQKVLWCLAELDLAYERIDAGMQFGKNTEAPYLAMNPNGRVPTLVDGDYVLWESNSVMRYLCMAYGENSPIYPSQPKARASVDRWLDWTLSTCRRSTGRFSGRGADAVEKSAWSRSRRSRRRAVVWRNIEAQMESRRSRRRPVHDRRHRARRLCGRWLGVRASQAKSRPSTLVCAFAARPAYPFIAPPMT